MIQFTSGDMFSIEVDARVNTVNCEGVMGKGVALAFKNRYPEMFGDYKRACDAGLVRPGKMHVWKNLTGDWIINFPTKRSWRQKSRYDDIQAGLNDLKEYLQPFGRVKVALPALGCGNGGLDWSKVAPMIEETLKDLDADIFVFRPQDSRISYAPDRNKGAGDQKSVLIENGFRPTTFLARFSGTSAPLQGYVSGDGIVGANRWVLVSPSLEFDGREELALSAVAAQFAEKEGIIVAVTFKSPTSLKVADIFSQLGVPVVVLLPFGPMAIDARSFQSHQENRPIYISLGEFKKGWSRSLENRLEEFIIANAGCILISSPKLNLRANPLYRKWQEKSIFYLRYGAQSDSELSEFEKIGAIPIGRRTSGDPNLSSLYEKTLSDSEPVGGDGAGGYFQISITDIDEVDVFFSAVRDMFYNNGRVELSISNQLKEKYFDKLKRL